MLDDFMPRAKAFATKLGFQRDWYLILVAGGIGLVMSVVAVAFITPLRWGERWAENADATTLLWLVPVVPVIGALLTGIIHAVIPSGGRGPGVTKVMYAIHRHKSVIPWYIGVRKWLASTATILSGGSAGAEGPIVTIGSVIGSNVGRMLGVSPQHTATLLGCGAAAGLASVFNAPIAGVFFVLEILLRDFSLRTFTPIVIAAVISSAFTQAMLGDAPLFDASAVFASTASVSAPTPIDPNSVGLDPDIRAFGWQEIPNYLFLGILCGAFAALFIRVLFGVQRQFERLPVHAILKPVIGAILLGGLGYGSVVWFRGAESTGLMPDFYGNGYPIIKNLLTPSTYIGAGGMGTGASLLLAIIVLGLLKGIATCLTLGSGGAGGMFAPSLLLGAAVGGSFGYIVNALGWFPSADPAHYALVGMAAMVSATTHAPLTAILIVYEITRSYEVILPLMLAAVIATIVSRLVFRESVYTVKLTEQGVRLGAMSDLTILRRLTAADVPLVAPVFVQPTDSAQRLLTLSERLSVSDFVVTERGDKYVGLVTGADLKEALVHREAIPLLQVHELQRTDLPTVHPEHTLDVVLDRFATHDVNSLCVLDAGGAILGLITRSRLMHRYRQALIEE